jgi:hypothetical protein
VVFPAPFGPSKPKTLAPGISREKSSTAAIEPYTLRKFEILMVLMLIHPNARRTSGSLYFSRLYIPPL